MGKFDQLKKAKPGGLRTELPPPAEKVMGMLSQPEHAPLPLSEQGHQAPPGPPGQPQPAPTIHGQGVLSVATARGKYRRPDLRTDRTEQFSTKFRASFLRELHAVAKRDNKLLCEVLEDGFKLYEAGKVDQAK